MFTYLKTESEVFTMRKNFLEEFFKNRVSFTLVYKHTNQGEKRSVLKIKYKSNILNPEDYNIDHLKKTASFCNYIFSNFDCNTCKYMVVNELKIEIGLISEEILYHTRASMDIDDDIGLNLTAQGEVIVNNEIKNFQISRDIEDDDNFKFLQYFNHKIDFSKIIGFYIKPSKPFWFEISFIIELFKKKRR